jgi:uncharacterized phiE125 gp8 family phage protein
VTMTAFWQPPATRVPTPAPLHFKIEASDTLPVPLAAVREFLGLPDADAVRDAELAAFIRAAATQIEDFCQLSLLTTTWRMTVPFFSDRMGLLKRPFVALTALNYIREADGEIVAVPGTTYHTAPIAQDMGMIFRGHNKSWPIDVATRHDAVQATFTAGYGGPDDIPHDLRVAIMMTVAKIDSARGDDCGGEGGATSVYAMQHSKPSLIPPTVQSLLSRYTYKFLAVT